MKVELLNIKTLNSNKTAFNADIFVNGKQIGIASNSGDGSATFYKIFSQNDTIQLSKFCEKIPPEKVYVNSIKILEIKMSIEKLINTLFQSQNKIYID